MPPSNVVHFVRTTGRDSSPSLAAPGGLPADFVAGVADEILTPMQSAVGLIDGFLETALTSRQRLALETVRSSVEEALRRTHDLADFSRLQSGRLALALANFFVRATIGEALRGSSLRARKNGLRLVHRVDPDVPDGPEPEATRLRFSVRDSSVGAPRPQRAGSGLGFRIASRLIALMGGELNVDGQIGRGSTCAFAIRFALQPGA